MKKKAINWRARALDLVAENVARGVDRLEACRRTVEQLIGEGQPAEELTLMATFGLYLDSCSDSIEYESDLA